MRDRIERFAFPFSVGCVSHSSVDIVGSQPKKSSRADQSNAIPTISELVQSNAKTRASFVMKPNISAGINKVIKGFKNLFYKEEEGEEDEEERDMVIGFPTDVQHVAHIGWDGFNGAGSTAAMKSWDHKAPDLLSLPPISLSQFELAMAAQRQTD